MLRFDNVSKRYVTGLDVLANLSFEVAAGEMVFVTGHSGAGKSTLLKLVGLIERPTRGQVHVDGAELGRVRARGIPYLRRRIGMVFQDHRLLLDRSVFDNVALPLLITGTPRAEIARRVRAALDKVGLLARARAAPQMLSTGEQQRVSIARAIVNRPQIILADEPTANLDRASASKVIDALHAFHSVGVTCLISTHDEQVLDGAARVIQLVQGELVKEAA
jgi:cell division transport system ATP-binding protein